MISVTSEGFIVRRNYAVSLPVSGCEDKARFDSGSRTLRCSKFRQHVNIPNVERRQMSVCRTQARQNADPNEKHVRTRLSALIIDNTFDVDSSLGGDITVDHAIP
jgi:hypothetical protein